ncbi:MAG: hypothetical protein IJ362_06385 [Oscillospiraceae bacterium]|nr:hypothetical protein [Oscillospiraceae bacterium]
MRAKVDTTALVHPALMNENTINVYRISVAMKDTVDPVVLQQSLNTMVKRFPMICCRMAKDNFWYYTEGLGKITATEDSGRILASLTPENVFQQATNIMYSGNKIIMESFHSVADGFGAFTFMNGLLGEYGRLKYNTELEPAYWGTATEEEVEDGFLRYGNAKGRAAKPVKIRRPFSFPKRYPGDPLNFTTFSMNAKEMKKLARQYRCTLNELILAMVYSAIFKLDDTKDKDIVVAVPINLRNKFESPSLRNFSYLASAVLRNTGSTMAEIIREIRTQLHKQNNKEFLHKAITDIARLGGSPFMKMCPLSVKNFFIRLGVKLGADKTCMTVSNLGDLSYMLPAAADYIDHINIMLSPRRNSPYNCCVSTMNGNLNITFTHGPVEDPFLCGIVNWLQQNNISYATQLH